MAETTDWSAETGLAGLTRQLAPEIQALGLEPYVLQLEVDGLAVVPPEVTGLTPELLDTMVDKLLERAADLVGCEFSLDHGPATELEFPSGAGSSVGTNDGKLTQFLLQQLASQDRVFRDLAIHPVAVALMRHLIGPKATRFSSHNAFIKWQGSHGYGAQLGLHADQTAVPYPWGRRALTANTNWCLTDYSLDGGALAYVPGSHREGTRPVLPQAVGRAVPVAAPRGSVIVFHGATWHGAFPRKLPGMRLSIANYYRHQMITSQEDIKGGLDEALAADCNDPALFRELAGYADEFPYRRQSQPLPRASTHPIGGSA